MSVIRQQASRQVLVNYGGTILSAIAVLAIYPLDLHAYGLAQFLMATALFIVPFASLGTVTLVVKFFPEQSERARQGYLLNMLLVTGGAMLIFFALFFVFRNDFYDALDALDFESTRVKRYSLHLMSGAFLMIINRILTLHASNYKQIVVPAIYNTLLPKLVLPVLVLIAHFEWIGYYKFMWFWTASFGISTIGLVVYLLRIKALDLKWRTDALSGRALRRMAHYSAFTGLSVMASMMANRVDIIMITLLIGEKETGIYAIAFFIANILHIPTAAVWQIASPVVASAWENNETEKINRLYKRTSINLLTFGILIYFLALGCLDTLFSFSPMYEELSSAFIVFVILGMSKLVDLMMGINYQIIVLSRLYHYNIIFVGLLGVINVVLNYYFIQRQGITGAAIATCISIVIYHVAKLVFSLVKFGMHPFTRDTLKVCVLAGALYLVYRLVPAMASPVLQVLLFCSITIAVYLALLRLLRIDTDVVPYARQRLQALLGRKQN
ncbi:MAG: oligosaccharide flippase family protein [Saprospiraceae bacterium]|nr:oligosaccharide flippase family protein [Saprospiraceae bacterium]